MIPDEWLRDRTRWLVNPTARAISRAGVSPNLLTTLGLAVNVVAALLVSQGHFGSGGLVALVASLFDALDGALARSSGKGSPFGAFLDSTLDRFSEAVVYLGLLLHYAQDGHQMELALVYVTVVGSLMVSYARARAEGLGLQCKVGLLTRPERVCLLVAGLVLGIMPWMLWVLAVLTNVTVVQRMVHVWRSTQDHVKEPAARLK
jgi:CDP-diacylglycerol--glycerol-3-phosphate 3-phosphatidyltransferase